MDVLPVDLSVHAQARGRRTPRLGRLPAVLFQADAKVVTQTQKEDALNMTYALTILVLTVTAALAAAGDPSASKEATTQPAEPAATQPSEAEQSSENEQHAEDADTPPAADDKTAADTEKPTAQAPLPDDVDEPTLEVLTKVEKATHAIEAMTGKITYDRIQGLLGDKQRRYGSLVYHAGPPARFAIHLDRMLIDRAIRPRDRWYIFDGRWLVERLDDEKRFTKWQIVPPDKDPAEVDPLGAGEGPFALPIRVNKNDLVRRFKVQLVEPAEDDPADSVHLKLLPRDGVRVDFQELDLYYDKDTLLPVQVRTLDDAESGDESIIKLRDLDTNPDNVDTTVIDVSEPTERGWHTEVKPWEKDIPAEDAMTR